MQNNHPALLFFESVGRSYPNIWRMADDWSQKVGPQVGHKQGCVFSTGEAQAVALRLPGDKLDYTPRTLAAMVSWRATKGIYRFDDALYKALAATALEGDVPSHMLEHLPGWAVFVETPGLDFCGDAVFGFFASLSRTRTQNDLELIFLLESGEEMEFSVPLALHPIGDLVQLALDRAFSGPQIDYTPSPTERTSIENCLSTMISLLLYLCSEKPDIENWTVPLPKTITMGNKKRLVAAKHVRRWDVGLRLGAAFRKAVSESPANDGGAIGSGVSPRAHMRKAHWHTYWVGKRGEQTLSLRWLAPIAVNVDPNEPLPAVIHPVMQ